MSRSRAPFTDVLGEAPHVWSRVVAVCLVGLAPELAHWDNCFAHQVVEEDAFVREAYTQVPAFVRGNKGYQISKG